MKPPTHRIPRSGDFKIVKIKKGEEGEQQTRDAVRKAAVSGKSGMWGMYDENGIRK
jgi:hypothetical protein